MWPYVFECSATMALLDWPGKEMVIVTDEGYLRESLCKLGELDKSFGVIEVLMLNLSETLEIRQRQKANGVQVYTVDLRTSAWSTMQEAKEEVLFNKYRIGSAIVHDVVAGEVVQAVEEGLECYELQGKLETNGVEVAREELKWYHLQGKVGRYMDDWVMEDDVFLNTFS